MTYVSKGSKELRRNWPHETGLIAGTTKQEGRQSTLIPQGLLGVKTTVLRKDKVGF